LNVQDIVAVLINEFVTACMFLLQLSRKGRTLTTTTQFQDGWGEYQFVHCQLLPSHSLIRIILN